MRILVHDYGGYHFPLQLSRELALQGHTVMHAYCASLRTTPPGIDEKTPLPKSLQLAGIDLGEPLNKYNFLKRWRQERQYGRLIVKALHQFKPALVISANTPLDAQQTLQRACRLKKIRFIFWIQDVLGLAAQRILSKKIPGPGHLIGAYYVRLERKLLKNSDQIIAISDAFKKLIVSWDIPATQIHVIPNWANIEDIPVRTKANQWALDQRLADKFCFLYAGTLGMKHNPDLLLQLAQSMLQHSNVRVVVVSQGLGAEWLSQKAEAMTLRNLIILPFQPADQVPSVLATGDVLVGLLEQDAALYSVPSKVLTYLCAGRPLLLAIPAENEAARMVSAEMGIIVSPDDRTGFLEGAKYLYETPSVLDESGKTARRYAVERFSWQKVYSNFQTVLFRQDT